MRLRKERNLKKGYGNVREQRKRRKEMMKIVPRQEIAYELIDGNYSHYPVGFCKSRKAWLTLGLINTHKCVVQDCVHYSPFEMDKVEQH